MVAIAMMTIVLNAPRPSVILVAQLFPSKTKKMIGGVATKKQQNTLCSTLMKRLPNVQRDFGLELVHLLWWVGEVFK